jgi:hypothetical protein
LTLALLGAAQRELFHRSAAASKDSKRRQTALQQWLLILDRNNCHYTKDHLVWGLLSGGIVPLLYDCACSAENAECIEVGRLGLSALLPVIRGDSGYDSLFRDNNNYFSGSLDVFVGNDEVDLKDPDKIKSFALSVSVQMAALTALSNLLVAAHPIMPRHARKIICELVAFLRNMSTSAAEDDVSSQRLTVQQLAFHTAAMAMVICGDPAIVILDGIAGSEEYDDGVVNIVREIRLQAGVMKK